MASAAGDQASPKRLRLNEPVAGATGTRAPYLQLDQPAAQLLPHHTTAAPGALTTAPYHQLSFPVPQHQLLPPGARAQQGAPQRRQQPRQQQQRHQQQQQPQQRASSAAAAAPAAKQLAAAIRSCNNPSKLRRFLDQHGSSVPHTHITSLFIQLGSIARSSGSAALGGMLALADRVSGVATPLLPQCDARTLSTMLHTVGALPSSEALTQFVAALLADAQPKLPGFSPQDLSTAAVALATMGHDSPAFVMSLAQAAQPKLPQFNPQNLANTAWALATLGCSSPELTDALVAAALPQVPSLNPRELGCTAWALASLGHRDSPSFAQAIVAAAQAQLQQHSPRSLSNVVWALATMGHAASVPTPFLDTLLAVSQPQLPSFKPSELAELAWALASTTHSTTHAFLSALITAMHPLLPDLKPTDLAHTAWALATLRHSCPAFTDALGASAQPQLPGFRPAELAELAWAFAVLGSHGPPAAALLHAAVQHLDALTDGDLRRLQQLLLSLSDSGHALQPGGEGSPLQPLQSACLQAWIRFQMAPEPPCDPVLQQQLLLACQHVGGGCQVLGAQHRTEDGLFSMDVGLLLPPPPGTSAPALQVAVEVDGPSCYSRDEPRQALGALVLRNRFLRTRGWRVLSLPSHELAVLQGDEEQAAYVQRRCLGLLGAGAGGGEGEGEAELVVLPLDLPAAAQAGGGGQRGPRPQQHDRRPGNKKGGGSGSSSRPGPRPGQAGAGGGPASDLKRPRMQEGAAGTPGVGAGVGAGAGAGAAVPSAVGLVVAGGGGRAPYHQLQLGVSAPALQRHLAGAGGAPYLFTGLAPPHRDHKQALLHGVGGGGSGGVGGAGAVHGGGEGGASGGGEHMVL